jgi:predicted nucleic acid-binding protein
MSYWDTSALVKLYSQEPDSALFESYARNNPGRPVTSRIALYEARATFVRKEAEAILRPGGAEKLYTQICLDASAGELRLVEFGADVEQAYGQVLVTCFEHTPAILLRTLDALHLASARVAGEPQVVATDKRLRDAAKLLGFLLFPV